MSQGDDTTPHRLVVPRPRSRLLGFALGFPVLLAASVALARALTGEGAGRILGALATLACLAALAAIAGYRVAFVFDSKVRVAQRRTTLFGRALRVDHWPLNAVHEVEIVCNAALPAGKDAPLVKHWYQVRLGDLVVAPMLAGDPGRDAALKLARRLADHLSLRMVER